MIRISEINISDITIDDVKQNKKNLSKYYDWLIKRRASDRKELVCECERVRRLKKKIKKNGGLIEMINLPNKTYRFGAIKLVVWKNKRKIETDKKEAEKEILTFTLEKSYKTVEGWKTTSTFSEVDMLKAKLLIDDAIKDFCVKSDLPTAHI